MWIRIGRTTSLILRCARESNIIYKLCYNNCGNCSKYGISICYKIVNGETNSKNVSIFIEMPQESLRVQCTYVLLSNICINLTVCENWPHKTGIEYARDVEIVSQRTFVVQVCQQFHRLQTNNVTLLKNS